MADEIEIKLSAARTRLILDKPFLGALALRLPLVAADAKWCKTTATDARTLYYNPAYIEGLSAAQTEFVLAHEALHCALLHFMRQKHRVKRRWDLACDLVVNPLLVEDGLTPPPGALVMPELAGMSAEEIYPLIEDDSDEEPMDEHLWDGEPRPHSSSPTNPEHDSGDRRPEGGRAGAAPSRPLSAQGRETLAVQWRQRLAGAFTAAMQAGKLKGATARLVERMLQPTIPWRMLLARYVSAQARDDYSYARPGRREGEAILPRLRSHGIDLTVALDTSGSISRAEMQEFLAEVDALKGQLRARVVLHACDNALAPAGPWCCEPWEALTLPVQLPGGGGTSFVPVFDWQAAQDRAPDALLYFTDARGAFPAVAPPYPVIWLVKGAAPVPWGARIQLN